MMGEAFFGSAKANSALLTTASSVDSLTAGKDLHSNSSVEIDVAYHLNVLYSRTIST